MKEESRTQFIFFILSRIIGNMVIVSLAYTIPNLVVFISLVGCVCSVGIGFILPVLFFFKAGWNESTFNKKCIVMFFFIVSIIGSIFGIIDNLRNLLQ